MFTSLPFLGPLSTLLVRLANLVDAYDPQRFLLLSLPTVQRREHLDSSAPRPSPLIPSICLSAPASPPSTSPQQDKYPHRMTVDVPILSLHDLADPARRQELAHQLGRAARGSGFFQILTSESTDLIDSAFALTARTFSLPLEEKQKYKRNPQTNRGYDVLGGQALKGAIGVGHDEQEKNGDVADAETPDMKDGVDSSFEYWDRFGHGTNVLPSSSQVPEMKEVMAAYYNAMLSLATELMKLVALSLEMPEDTFAELCRLPAAALRLLHYPPELEGTGAGAHTDFGLITILATSGAPGLELFLPATASWVPIEPAPGAFVVNVGDILSLYTGGEYRSSLHRVVNKSGVRRYSIPFFLDGNSDVLVSPVRGPGMGKFAPVTVEQHLKTKFDASYYDTSAMDAMRAVIG
ncbi:hypothetical protein JCM11251_003348 [Rhodosporidiobolus azoricus]